MSYFAINHHTLQSSVERGDGWFQSSNILLGGKELVHYLLVHAVLVFSCRIGFASMHLIGDVCLVYHIIHMDVVSVRL